MRSTASLERSFQRLPRAPLTASLIRELVGLSQKCVAAETGTSLTEVRLYEAERLAVRDRDVRHLLDDAYAAMRRRLLTDA
jgi:hypothetical protein